MNNTIFDNAVVRHIQKLTEQERLANERKLQAQKFEKEMQEFPDLILGMAKRSTKLKKYLNDGTEQIQQSNFFDPSLWENTAPSGVFGVSKRNTHLGLAKKRVKKAKTDPGGGFIVRITLAVVNVHEMVESSMGPGLTVKASVPYYVQLVKENSTWTFDVYKYIGRSGFQELRKSPRPPEVMDVLKRLMNPKTFLETLFEFRAPKEELVARILA